MFDKNSTSHSRRDFLKGTLAVGASGTLVGLSGCAPKVVSEEEIIPTATPDYSSSSEKASFEIAPDPIPESEIIETKSADVVVIGAGASGFPAAYAAAKAGASVIILEKWHESANHGGWMGVIDSRAHEEAGITISRDEVMADIMRFGAYHPNAKLIKTYINESGRVMNSFLDLLDTDSKTGYMVDTDTKEYWPYREFPIGVVFTKDGETSSTKVVLLPRLESEILDMGGEILYSTPAVQLLRPDTNGNVTGVIAKNEDGYLQINANKGVIICAGCYGSNQEMLAKYSPRSIKAINNQYMEGTNTGDGILMGMWAGAAKQETDCPMLWDGMIEGNGIFVSIARQPWLYVNLLGERYANEDAPFGYTANQDINQPGSQKWAIWDGKWMTDKDKLHGTVCENMSTWTQETYDDWKERGVIIEADSIEELVEKMGVPQEACLASIERYNELVEKGVDEDFGKDPEKLTSIVQAPFGATKVGAGILVTLDGLRINTNMQVLDTEGAPIPGLYAAGNSSGDFFSNDYPITCMGSSLGRALTFGYLAGENAAN